MGIFFGKEPIGDLCGMDENIDMNYKSNCLLKVGKYRIVEWYVDNLGYGQKDF